MKPYQTLILDVDGVLIDSNGLKEANIKKAAQPFSDAEGLQNFLSYFIGNNGIPREGKVARFFGENSPTSQAILRHYGQLNQNSLKEVPLTPSALAFLERVKALSLCILAISGGAQEEVRETLAHKGIDRYLDGIYGGPTSKINHLKHLKPPMPGIYIGDSVHDYEVAVEYGFDFCFMWQFTQFADWQNFFAQKPNVKMIKNLAEWPL